MTALRRLTGDALGDVEPERRITSDAGARHFPDPLRQRAPLQDAAAVVGLLVGHCRACAVA